MESNEHDQVNGGKRDAMAGSDRDQVDSSKQEQVESCEREQVDKRKLEQVESSERRQDSSDIIMYTTEDGLAKIEATFDGDTVWLSIDQMAALFQRDKSTISRHIKNVFAEGELSRDSVVANFATTATDGKSYQVDYYNLDVIISVGYRRV